MISYGNEYVHMFIYIVFVFRRFPLAMRTAHLTIAHSAFSSSNQALSFSSSNSKIPTSLPMLLSSNYVRSDNDSPCSTFRKFELR